jgi:hypothetical protein
MKHKAVGWLALACAVLLILLNGAPHFTNASRPPHGNSSPAIALQFPHSIDDIDAILGDAPSPDREVMRIKRYAGFAFLGCYLALAVALAKLLRKRLALLAAVLAAASALAYAAQLVVISRTLDTPLRDMTGAMVARIDRLGVATWVFGMFAAAGFAGLWWNEVFWKRRQPLQRVFSGFLFASAALGFYGIYDNSILFWALVALFSGFLGMSAAFLLR